MHDKAVDRALFTFLHTKVYTHRFEYVLGGVIAFLLHALLHEVNAQLQVKVLFLQSCDLLCQHKKIHISFNMQKKKTLNKKLQLQ